MRRYFAAGVEGVSKAMNLGNLLRIAHAFEASFFFTVNAHIRLADAQSDTSRAQGQIPYYAFPAIADFRLPTGCELIGVEIAEDAVELPRFRHPLRAAYVFGGERTSLSSEMLARCTHVVKIPTRFSINVGMAGAIVLYDRLITLGGYARPISRLKPSSEVPPRHVWGAPLVRKRALP